MAMHPAEWANWQEKILAAKSAERMLDIIARLLVQILSELKDKP